MYRLNDFFRNESSQNKITQSVVTKITGLKFNETLKKQVLEMFGEGVKENTYDEYQAIYRSIKDLIFEDKGFTEAEKYYLEEV